jgi:hypothetical protein
VKTDRRGFIGALLAAPLAAKLLSTESWTIVNSRTWTCVFPAAPERENVYRRIERESNAARIRLARINACVGRMREPEMSEA